jgi:hypothetical protein
MKIQQTFSFITRKACSEAESFLFVSGREIVRPWRLQPGRVLAAVMLNWNWTEYRRLIARLREVKRRIVLLSLRKTVLTTTYVNVPVTSHIVVLRLNAP